MLRASLRDEKGGGSEECDGIISTWRELDPWVKFTKDWTYSQFAALRILMNLSATNHPKISKK